MNINSIFHRLKGHQPTVIGENQYMKSAVLIPLIEIDGETHILFEVRSMQMKHQPGDICFPGGRIDKEDKSPKHGAIRETVEELGVYETNIKNVVPFDYIVSDSGRIIYPFVGTIQSPYKIIPNPSEVEEVFTVPLTYFLHTEPDIHKVSFQVIPDKNFPFDLIIGGENYQWNIRQVDELFYQYDGKVIWGLTARILNHFIHTIK